MIQTRKSRYGTSLVETLVSMSLLGIILIPMLFLSSAFFLAQLAKSRQNVDVSVNAARFTNQLMEELALTQMILPDSNSTEIHFAYYDQVREAVVKRGYRLSASGSYRILEKLNFHEINQNWTAISPYGGAPASQVLLPPTAVFSFCSATSCSVSPGEAVFLRLSGWEFMPRANTLRKVDFATNLDIYLATGANSGGGMILAHVPQEIYSFSKASSFGSSAYLGLAHLNPTGQKFNYTYLQTAVAAGLSTILPAAVDYPGVDAVAVSPVDGRVYFGQNATPGQFWTWHGDTGLSTLLPAQVSKPGHLAIGVSPMDGRVYFGEDGAAGNIWSWQTGTGLSTILPATESYPGVESLAVSPMDGRLYFGENATGQFWTWKAGAGAGTGLSTLFSVDETQPGFRSTAVADDGRVFFGENAVGRAWSWKDGDGLSTMLSVNRGSPGYNTMRVHPVSGRAFFTGYSTNIYCYSWKDNVLTEFANLRATAQTSGVLEVSGDGRASCAIMEDGNSDRVTTYSWKEGESTLSPDENMEDAVPTITMGTLDGRLFMSDNNSTAFRMSKDGAAFSNFTPRLRVTKGSHVFGTDGRFYSPTNAGTGQFYMWAEGTGLSTLLPGTLTNPGLTAVAKSSDDKVYFGQSTASAQMYRWHESSGLSTLLPATVSNPGASNSMKAHEQHRLYFGQNTTSGLFWSWDAGVAGSSTVRRLTVTGNNSNQPLQFGLPAGTLNYSASQQDATGDFYLANSSGGTMDRYSYNTGAAQFQRTAQFSYGSTPAVGAIAIDQAKTGIALLDTTNKQIDYYSNRQATGAQTAANQYSVSPANWPTGLAVSGRTGNYLVIDSSLQGTTPNKYANLYVFNESGTQLTGSPYRIYVDDNAAQYPLSVDLKSETNFKIQYDDEKNILYLVAPNAGYVVALSMPAYF